MTVKGGKTSVSPQAILSCMNKRYSVYGVAFGRIRHIIKTAGHHKRQYKQL